MIVADGSLSWFFVLKNPNPKPSPYHMTNMIYFKISVIECTRVVDHGVLGAVTVLSIHPLHPPLDGEEQERKKCKRIPSRVAMEVVHCCQLAAAIELCDFGSGRIEPSSLISHGRVKKRDEFSAVVNTFWFRVSGRIGGCVRGSWQEGRDGALRKRCCFRARGNERLGEGKEELKVCVRCGTAYRDEDNSPVACKYHGHMTGDRGLYALAPPHQGIDGEWTDASGVIVYKWNNENKRPSTGSKNWKRRWTCCGVYAEDAVPCRSGRHVSYDDGATRF